MANEHSRRVPPDKAATPDEVIEAINGLTAGELLRLKQSAKWRVRGLGRMAKGRDWEDLFHDTIAAFLKPGGRRWRKDEVDFVWNLIEAMRSVASNWKDAFDEEEAILESEMPATGRERQESYSIENEVGGRWNTQDELESREKIAKIDEIVAERELAALVWSGLRSEMSGPEIMEELKITRTQYDTEMTWIRRKARATIK